MILDAGFFVSVDRGEGRAREFLNAANARGRQLHSTHAVLAQCGATDRDRRALLDCSRRSSCTRWTTAGSLLVRSGTSDVVDAHLVVTAVRLSEPIMTGDTADIEKLVAILPGRRPVVHAWR